MATKQTHSKRWDVGRSQAQAADKGERVSPEACTAMDGREGVTNGDDKAGKDVMRPLRAWDGAASY